MLLLLMLAQEPGLVAEYFEGAEPKGAAVFVRVEAQVDYAPVTGDFYGSKLATRFVARWTGLLRAPKDGLYGFYAESNGGCRLWIDGELALDNSGGKDMEQKSDRVVLAAGDRAVRFEYVQAGGPSGVNLQWKPPGAGRSMIPASAFFHAAPMPAWDRAAWERRPAPPPTTPVPPPPPGRYAETDYGTFLARTFEIEKGTLVGKGLAVRVGAEAAVCYDLETVGVAAAWTGKFVTFPTGRDGIMGFPSIAGDLKFRGVAGPEGAKYLGHYRHGDRVVLSYRVGKTTVLESPGFEAGSFTRSFETDGPVTIPMVEGALVLEGPGRAKVSIPKAKVAPPEDLRAMTRGGPARWTPVVTKGRLGNEPGGYAVDTLTVPFANPHKAYMRLTALDFLPDGRAAVGTLDGDVWVVSGIDAKLERLVWTRFATGIYQPLGLRVVDGKVYVLGRDRIVRLQDLDGDGEADFYESFNGDGVVAGSFHEFAADLQTDPEGNFYYTRASTLSYATGGPHNGCLIKVSRDGSKLEVVAGGFRAPNGMGAGPRGELTVSDQQGNWVATCPINWVRPGEFYGFVQPDEKPRPRDPPLCWIPMDVDNSSGGQAWVPDGRWGPFAGRMLHTSYGQSRLFLVLVDEGSDPKQGGVVRFPLSFDSGIMRPRFNPADGQLYVAGMRGWQTTGVRDGCLQRVRYTGRPTRMPLGVKVRKGGLDLEFAEPVDREIAADAESWSAQVFHVESTADYGSPEYRVSDRKKRGREPLEVASAKVSEDGRTVSLGLPGLRPVTNLVLRFAIRAADGARLSHEVALTVHRLPD